MESTTTMTFESIYNDNHESILRLINYKLGNDKETAEELTNDVFLRVDKHLGNYDSNLSSFNTWLYNIAGNIVIDYWRKKSLDTFSISSVTDKDGKETFDAQCKSKNPLEIMVNYEQGEMVQNAIDSLPKGYRRLTEMFFLESCSHKEIQAELDLPNGTVKGKIYRAKNMLRDLLS